MKQIVSFLAAFLLVAGPASAQSPSAEQLLSQAKTKASVEHKAIFVHFGASWCVWCRRLDAFLERPDIKPVFEKHFIPVKLVVQEGDKKKALENAGGEALLKEWGGPAGLPYSVFLDAQGALIVSSKREGQNIGYPAKPEEIDWFAQMMKKAAPKMAEDDLKTIETALKTPKGT
jgi:thiol-disulfide isomerase/thioredoxin